MTSTAVGELGKRFRNLYILLQANSPRHAQRVHIADTPANLAGATDRDARHRRHRRHQEALWGPFRGGGVLQHGQNTHGRRRKQAQKTRA